MSTHWIKNAWRNGQWAEHHWIAFAVGILPFREARNSVVYIGAPAEIIATGPRAAVSHGTGLNVVSPEKDETADAISYNRQVDS